jgi:hypothetical protein
LRLPDSGLIDLNDQRRQREKLSRDMTAGQIAEAERLVAEWQPNPTECEAIPVHAGN